MFAEKMQRERDAARERLAAILARIEERIGEEEQIYKRLRQSLVTSDSFQQAMLRKHGVLLLEWVLQVAAATKEE